MSVTKRHCDSCKWVAKAEIAIAICVHGAECETRAVVQKIEVIGHEVHKAEGRLHWPHLGRAWGFWHRAGAEAQEEL